MFYQHKPNDNYKTNNCSDIVRIGINEKYKTENSEILEKKSLFDALSEKHSSQEFWRWSDKIDSELFEFLGEKFNTQYDKIAKRFEGASEEFLNNLKKECISNYRKTGSVINEVSVPSNAWIYRDINSYNRDLSF